MLKSVIHRLGETPQRSLRCFQLGLLLFAISVGLIYGGAIHWIGWQMAGLVLLPVALCFAAWGYIGILANRLSHFFYRMEQNKKPMD